ncbi:hypothetical protein [Nostoc sp. FACHB-110]|uniref:hypothetical protein n=1 Tax=Nostoc sp. FACHB-110 TaxID=2692834 RepID=UPI0016856F72|nr:hypothetical protein [Nostoc sp. FACHB-110]MBD2440584.1 hypothetical protein [Nostoc sp. FACHB-110]
MRSQNWNPPIELSAIEQSIVKRITRAKLFTFLRQYRHELFNEEFQKELSKLYTDSPKGQPPVPHYSTRLKRGFPQSGGLTK